MNNGSHQAFLILRFGLLGALALARLAEAEVRVGAPARA